MNWKFPTWKGATGLLALAVSVITYLSTQPTTIGHGSEAVLGVIGGALLIIERWADAQDYKTDQTAAANTALAEAQKALAAAQSALGGSPATPVTGTLPPSP